MFVSAIDRRLLDTSNFSVGVLLSSLSCIVLKNKITFDKMVIDINEMNITLLTVSVNGDSDMYSRKYTSENVFLR